MSGRPNRGDGVVLWSGQNAGLGVVLLDLGGQFQTSSQGLPELDDNGWGLVAEVVDLTTLVRQYGDHPVNVVDV